MLTVSVIIPTYNRKPQLKEAIASVIAQTYQPQEIIVIDDASSDHTSEWIKEDYPAIVLITLPQNKGAAAARNAGIRIAKGELIAFLDSDDLWLPGYLSSQVDCFTARPDIAGVFSSHYKLDKNGMEYPVSHHWPVDDPRLHLIINNNFIHTMSLIILRKDVFQKTGLLREDLFICHDREFYVRVLEHFYLQYNPDHLVRRRYSPNQVTGNMSLWYKEAICILDIFFKAGQNESYANLRHLAYYKANLRFYRRAINKRRPALMLMCRYRTGWYGLFLDRAEKKKILSTIDL
jgi:glycosyltransferase involved in cell wall biosynthesis